MQITRTVFRDDHEMLRTTVRRFLERVCAPRQLEWDKAGRVDRETWLKAGREGLLCLTLPTEYGGGGGDFGHAAILNEEVNRAGLSGLGFGVHSDIIAPYIARIGNEEQKQQWLPKACTGESILAIGMTEPGTGSDLKAIRTTALRDGDEYVINGSKTFISNGLNADLIVLVCKTDPSAGAKGVSLIVVEASREGFRRGRKLDKVGMHSQDTAELFFDNVRVPVSNRLGEEGKGFAYLMGELPQERLSIAIGAAAKLEACLEHTINYVKDRRAFNQTVWDFQNTKFKLADIKAQATAVRLLVDHYLAEHVRRRLTLEEAAIAKLFATESLGKALDDMVQLHGGYGYMLEYPVARAFADARVNRIYGGTSEVMRDLISRKL
ncbi:acyl-CoA dehydrogenase family protein [Caballeronia novacaledonica]|jgi:acyl-CoA dehydrogenase|uniref:Acyl-CoA dehydrogenase family protein n=1 Tax=Caballeronia novacaledonica TaxID=1544861 RepID=A0ACB5R3Z7_9BURK|nr:acyl-CoA dehydrogenase family protein [Caballeronia novacaledonica]GJH08435.1 acyl-CoA dehydrogenase family protein [Caballeronia novacaledonica]GJH21805.1 acyl-CoA dehydrogenase family protein [Caballeronia novacaledonica]